MQTIDINCDVGEGLNNEEALMHFISSCSIACGAHAGNLATIEKTVKLAIEYHVKIGAHPSFPDVKNFGRKMMDISPAELQQSIEDQINLVKQCTTQLGADLHHVKAHGALYNLSANDVTTARILVSAVKNSAPDVFLYVPYTSKLAEVAKSSGLKTKIEAFADRNYNSNLTLVSRKYNDAVLTNKYKVVAHLLKMIQQNKVISRDGVEVKIMAETYCFHGDNPSAVELLKYVSKELANNKIKIA